MKIIFILHVLATFFAFGIALYQQIVHFPLLRYIGPYQYPVYYEKQKMQLTILTFPVYSLEVFTSIVLMVTFFAGGEMTPEKQNSFFTYLVSIILLLFIHLVTFYFIKTSLKKLVTNWQEKTLKELRMYNLVRLGLWLGRLIILIIIVVRPV